MPKIKTKTLTKIVTTNKLIRFLPAILWMGVIFYFSSRQTTGIGGDVYWVRFAILKTFHLIEYGILAVLLFFALRKYKWSIILAYLYGLSDEFHQRFTPGRTSRFRDTLFDLAGILIGLFILIEYLKPNFFKKISIQSSLNNLYLRCETYLVSFFYSSKEKQSPRYHFKATIFVALSWFLSSQSISH